MYCQKPKAGPERTDIVGDHFGVDPRALRRHVNLLRKNIKASGVDFDAIAFSGYSGALVAGPLSLSLKKPTVIVNGIYPVCGPAPWKDLVRDYIIVDDVIDSGETVRYILRRVRDIYPQARCTGVFVFNCLANHDPDRTQEKVGPGVKVYPGSIQYPY